MSIKLMGAIWSDRSDTLTATETSILVRMADFAAEDGTSVYPGLTKLSLDCKIHRRTVQTAIKSLVDKGFLILMEKAAPDLHRTNVYRISVDKLYNKPLDKFTTGGPTPPGAGGPTPPGAGGPTPPDPSLRSTIKNHHQGDDDKLETLIDKLPPKEIVEDWISKKGSSSQKKDWVESKAKATTDPVKYLRAILKNKPTQIEEKAAFRPHLTPEETLAQQTSVVKAEKIPEKALVQLNEFKNRLKIKTGDK